MMDSYENVHHSLQVYTVKKRTVVIPGYDASCQNILAHLSTFERLASVLRFPIISIEKCVLGFCNKLELEHSFIDLLLMTYFILCI